MSELIKGKTSLVVDGNEKRNLQRNLSGFDEKLMSRLVALPDIAANQVNIQERYIHTYIHTFFFVIIKSWYNF